jgi:uncharacterized membrane protein
MMEQSTVPEVKWGEWIGGGWQMLMDRWQVWVPMMLVFILAMIIPILPVYLLLLGAGLATDPSDPGSGAAIGLLAPVVGLVGGLIVLCMVGFLLGGVYRTAFKQMRGEPISIGDLFSGKDLIVNMLITIFLVALCAMGGALLCILPAFIVAGLLMFAMPLVAERGLSPMDALRTSFEKTKGNWLMFTLFAFVVTLIGSVGQLACYVGLLVTYPLQFLITAVAYRDLFGVRGAGGGIAAPQAYASPSWQQGGQPSYMPPPPQFAPPSQPQSFNPPPQQIEEPLPPTAVMPPAVPAPEQISCPHCKAQLTRTARFCNYCGKPL